MSNNCLNDMYQDLKNYMRTAVTVAVLATVMLSVFACATPEIEVTRVVELEVTREIETQVEVTRVIEVPVEVTREVTVSSEDVLPIEVEVTREIEVHAEVTREIVVPVEVTREVQATREVEVAVRAGPPVEVEATREIQVPVEVTRVVEVPVEIEVTREVEVEVTREIQVVITATPVPAPVVTIGRSRTNPLPAGSLISDALTELRVLAVEHPWDTYQEVNPYNDDPADGFEYLWLRFEVTFLGHIDTTLDWFDIEVRVVGNEATVYSPAPVVVENDTTGQEVFGGGSFVFDEVFEVSSTDSGFVLIYESDPDDPASIDTLALKENPCWETKECFPKIYAVIDTQPQPSSTDGQEPLDDEAQEVLSSDPYERGKTIADFWWRNVWEAYPDVFFTPEEPRRLEQARGWASSEGLGYGYPEGTGFDQYEVWVGKSERTWYQQEFLPLLVGQLSFFYYFADTESFESTGAQELMLNDIHLMFTIFREYTDGNESYTWTPPMLGNMIWVDGVGWIEHNPHSPNCDDIVTDIGHTFGENVKHVCYQDSLFTLDGESGKFIGVVGNAAYLVDRTRFFSGPRYHKSYIYE